MVENVDHCFLKHKMTSSTHIYSVHCRGGKKAENVHIQQAGIREFGFIFLKKN